MIKCSAKREVMQNTMDAKQEPTITFKLIAEAHNLESQLFLRQYHWETFQPYCRCYWKAMMLSKPFRAYVSLHWAVG